jgi:CBS domain-containing protein
MTTPIDRVRARDVMARDIISVTPVTRILDIHSLLVEEEIHGAPVVDSDGIVRGVVSALDLLRAVRDGGEPGAAMTSTAYYRDELPYPGPDWAQIPEDLQDHMQELTADDIMTRQIVTVPPDASLEQVARTMLDQRIHRVLVGAAGSLVGLITTFDLLPYVAAGTPVEDRKIVAARRR